MFDLSTSAARPDGPDHRLSPSAIVAALGAAVMTAGTFAPWLASGASNRNLYRSAGLVERLAGLGRPVGLALDALPLTGLYCVAAGVAYVMGRRRIAAGAIALLAVVFAGIASAALANRRPGAVHLRAVGPSLTLAGALLCLGALLAATGHLQHAAQARRRGAPLRPTSATTTASGTDAPPNPLPNPVTNPATNQATDPVTDPSQGRPRTMEFR